MITIFCELKLSRNNAINVRRKYMYYILITIIMKSLKWCKARGEYSYLLKEIKIKFKYGKKGYKAMEKLKRIYFHWFFLTMVLVYNTIFIYLKFWVCSQKLRVCSRKNCIISRKSLAFIRKIYAFIRKRNFCVKSNKFCIQKVMHYIAFICDVFRYIAKTTRFAKNYIQLWKWAIWAFVIMLLTHDFTHIFISFFNIHVIFIIFFNLQNSV